MIAGTGHWQIDHMTVSGDGAAVKVFVARDMYSNLTSTAAANSWRDLRRNAGRGTSRPHLPARCGKVKNASGVIRARVFNFRDDIVCTGAGAQAAPEQFEYEYNSRSNLALPANLPGVPILSAPPR